MSEETKETPRGGLEPGTTIDDRYEIISFLGHGGFAKVYKARHVHIQRELAIKFLNTTIAGANHGEFEERFLREAQTAASIDHPNVVTIHDFGFYGDERQPYIVMELLDGSDLEEYLEEHGGMPIEKVLPLFIDVLEALGEGHDAGIVHKDLKPANLFMVQPGGKRESLQVLDFGVATISQSTEKRLTGTGQILGTPQYLSPEYIGEQLSTPALDVYQIGLILVEALTGRTVVQTFNPFECLMAHCNGKLEIPRMLLESSLGPVLSLALHVDHKKRFPDGNAFAEALAALDLEVLKAELADFDPLDVTTTSPPSDYDASSVTAAFDLEAENAPATVATPAVGSTAKLPTEKPTSDVFTKDTPSDAVTMGGPLSGQFDQPNSGNRTPMFLAAVAVVLLVIIVVVFFGNSDSAPEDGEANAASSGASEEGESEKDEASDETRGESGAAEAAEVDGNNSTGGTDVAAGSDQPSAGEIAKAAGDKPTEGTPAKDAMANAEAGSDQTEDGTSAETGGTDLDNHAEGANDPAQPEAAATVSIFVTSTPTGAEVHMGDESMGATPTKVDVPQSDAPVQLTLSRSGYEELAFEVVPSENVVLEKKMTRKGRTRPSSKESSDKAKADKAKADKAKADKAKADKAKADKAKEDKPSPMLVAP